MSTTMSDRGRSLSPRPLNDDDVDMDGGFVQEKLQAKVVVVSNLTRAVVDAHLRAIFGFYGEVLKIDLPVFGKSGQNRGRAALEYSTPAAAHKAASHMDGGQLDGAILKVELSEEPVRSRSRSRPRYARNGVRDMPRSSLSRSRSRSRGPPVRRRPTYDRDRDHDREPRYGGDSYRGRGYGRHAPPGRNTYRPSRSRTRSRSPIRRRDGLGPRRRSPSYDRGGYRGRSRSRSYVRHSSRSHSRSYSPSRSRSSRSRSYSSYTRSSRSRSRSSYRSKSRSASRSRERRSYSRDDIRDSRSRSPE